MDAMTRAMDDDFVVDPDQLREEIVAAVRAGREMPADDEAGLADAVIARLEIHTAGEPGWSRRLPPALAMLRVVEVGSGLGSAILGFTILVFLEQSLLLNRLAGSPGTPQPFSRGALAPVTIVLAVVVVAAWMHAVFRYRMALAALVLASAVVIVGFAGVEVCPSADPSLTLALSFTDPAVTVGAVGLAMLAAVTGVSIQSIR